MSDAVGGAVNLALIVFFVVVIALFMAFTVNYQKAFNVKNKIISIYEENNGRCEKECINAIDEYEKTLGYGKVEMKDNSDHCIVGRGYCVKGVETNKPVDTQSVDYNSNVKYCYYEIRTQVEIEIPVINNLMGLRMFQVTGQTSSMKTIDPKSCDDIAKLAKTG